MIQANEELGNVEALVVDDDMATAKLVKIYLERSGFQVRTCSDASHACWEIASRPPHIVVSDWNMPDMDGATLCNWIRQHQTDRYIYFILMTAHERFFDAVDGFDAGADDYLRKPIDPGELLARVKCGARILKLQQRLDQNVPLSADQNQP